MVNMRLLLLGGVMAALLGGCALVGPDFHKPEAPKLKDWTSADPVISRDRIDVRNWWTVFNDPVLNDLIEQAYQQNPTLQMAGLRIFEARARLGITEGSIFPQTQQATGSASKNRISKTGRGFIPGIGMGNTFSNYQLGFDVGWELDFWGRFRRGIESAEASLNASVADYDAALVTLTAEVARAYVNIRTLQARLALARDNIALQEKSLNIARIRFKHGATTELDVQQARANLAETRALVPVLYGTLRQAMNALSLLLGQVPGELKLPDGGIPVPPQEVIAGIPADLLRRRPDVRRAEFLAASQNAQIGVAESDLYPHFSLLGSIGLQSSTGALTTGNLVNATADSLTYGIGPSFSWKILNYGRVRNNIRVQDARYQQTLVNYHDTVLRAYREVEDNMIAFSQSQKERVFREHGAQAARRSAELANIQYREGSTDFQRVISSEREMVTQQDKKTRTQGDVALHLISIYKALGGGWALREGKSPISQKNRDAMAARTNWGDMLAPLSTDGEKQ